MHETQMHETSSFLTLTYNDEHLPPDGSLVLAHWQNFAKRVRKKLGPFRFYHCGEYGDENGRPHYHALMWGHDFSEDRVFFTKHRGNNIYTSSQLDELWTHGFCQIGQISFQSAAYVARYIMKKIHGQQAENHYEGVDFTTGEITELRPEYTTMSRKPGIGKSWFDKYASDVYPDDFVISNGKKARPPAYYDNLYGETNPDSLALIKEGRAKSGRKHRANNTFERLRVRETVLEQKLQSLKRKL